ncbi:hypothetical protein AGABI2DRAFT_132657 [Agaricus bisporus var. bisporus H97]|uniref:hypothetical protein n=1 Tax=Agaricus bisporus var. bisporus (strain H97 / ATCC MYA-4626 / FGSC 10389) TaxID=936046 RepID=UPI00029F668A|nr:hypothetical protein AGABI2DRAFT_132657 [Agaricus bisporus var. bisporus H97]EKV50925.1 hypothetical protein AGABI2DRAFT_132657 [Agaricus bisporus var. bisporus H97]
MNGEGSILLRVEAALDSERVTLSRLGLSYLCKNSVGHDETQSKPVTVRAIVYQ